MTRDMIFTFAVSVESSTAILEQLVVVSKLVVWFSCVVSLTIAMQQDNLSGPFEGKSISFCQWEQWSGQQQRAELTLLCNLGLGRAFFQVCL